ncbi:5678_t:CDS:1, partial [Racocetra persica]
MPKISKQKLKARKAGQASANAWRAAQRKNQIDDINQKLIQMDDKELQLIHQSIVQSTDSKLQLIHQSVVQSADNQRTKQTMLQNLTNMIKQLSNDQLKS